MSMLFPFLGLGNIFLFVVLILNALAVLNEERFLARVGWSSSSVDPSFGGQQDAGLKSKMIAFITSIRTLMRIPLIGINIIIIVYQFLLG